MDIRVESAARRVDAHRLSSRLLVIGLLVLAVPTGVALHAQLGEIPVWWSLVLLVPVLVAGVTALDGRDRWAARALWINGVVGATTLPLVVSGTLDGPVWVEVLSPVSIAACVLVSRRTVVCVGALAVYLASGAVALEPMPERSTPLRLLLLVAVWAVALALLRTLEHAQRRVEGVQDAAVEEFVAARAAEATVRAEQAWDAYLHDEVVAALVVVADGETDAARSHAARVLSRPWDVARDSVPTPWVGSGSLDSVLRHRPGAETVIDIAPEVGAVPDDVRRAVHEALSEALRNVNRHAYGPGGEGPTRVEVVLNEEQVRVVVSDEGCGFDPRGVLDSRLGMAISIQARMDAVGGWSRIDSAPGRGTRVELGWTRTRRGREW